MIILECAIVDDEPSSVRVIENYIDKLEIVKLNAKFNSAIDLINSNLLSNIDLIFLDINMPDMNGLDFLRTISNPPHIILTTAYREYAAESYEYDVIDYLHKPFSFERFLSAIDKLKRRINDTSSFSAINSGSQDFILIKIDKIYRRINFNNINAIESMGDYAKIITNEDEIVFYSTLKNIIHKLPTNFLRIHKSYIININKITSLEDNTVFMDKKYYPIGQRYKKNLLSKVCL